MSQPALPLRFWEYNHSALFPERVLAITDGFPLLVCGPKNKFLARLLRSGKYKTFVFKGELSISLCGFPIDYTGLHIGIRNDGRLWKENLNRIAQIFKWEYWLGDKAYVGCAEMLTEIKKPRGGDLTPREIKWNAEIQHDRARVEHLIAVVTQKRAVMTTRWRGSHTLLDGLAHIAAHMTGLEERMKGPRYDVYGPWPVCSPAVMARYP